MRKGVRRRREPARRFPAEFEILKLSRRRRFLFPPRRRPRRQRPCTLRRRSTPRNFAGSVPTSFFHKLPCHDLVPTTVGLTHPVGCTNAQHALTPPLAVPLFTPPRSPIRSARHPLALRPTAPIGTPPHLSRRNATLPADIAARAQQRDTQGCVGACGARLSRPRRRLAQQTRHAWGGDAGREQAGSSRSSSEAGFIRAKQAHSARPPAAIVLDAVAPPTPL
ncbi:hypothetical protein PLICRDRAFT_180567 [Plicaturopsis crispa FD-325 SS-3]|uniref:Uncharacterized protein n=1 Tax=Plicaturopsis crispa FD-325 SS-3 TaxID=944288 RepID=A0A0C9T5D9_PLICR|nr:hypothetical protein PLICRDRAFT_180567 [Plicaturopsis crispa FD-325 SS-3]